MIVAQLFELVFPFFTEILCQDVKVTSIGIVRLTVGPYQSDVIGSFKDGLVFAIGNVLLDGT